MHMQGMAKGFKRMYRMKELVLGCGRSRKKSIYGNDEDPVFSPDTITVDINPAFNPTIVHDLNHFPWPFEDNTFDVIHAYHVLEHLGRQGDHKHFFDTFYEIWRILKPDGTLRAIVPRFNSVWTWGDPGHTRVINQGSLTFISKKEIDRNRKKMTAMTEYDFRGDFDIIQMTNTDKDNLAFVLKAIK